MLPESSIPNLAHVIQLAVAPVFLLTALSTMLAVLTNRLARVVDRTRKLEVFILDHPERSTLPRNELVTLFRRTVLCNRAISLCTLTSLLICVVIALLFISTLMSFNAALAVATLFVASMASFICALLSFLQEIRVASKALENSAKQILELTNQRIEHP
jgi:ABC-type transporter Mla maintaining outer membrane lipid asymmetry permease subunit MlaE